MVRVYLSGDAEHDRVLTAFYDGCPQSKVLTALSNYEPSDVAVIFGVYKRYVPKSAPRGAVFQRQRDKNLTTVVLETGYVNRGGGENHHYAAGLNGLNGRADFRNAGMPDDRRLLLGDLAKPCGYEPGEAVVLCGQIPWDASVDFSNHVEWLHEAAAQIKQATKRPVIFRPHPLGPRIEIPGTVQSMGRPLKADLAAAHACVTFNSNSGVEALLLGKPVYAGDCGSMCYEIAMHDWDQLAAPVEPARRQWLNNLAYAQWTLPEMRAGDTWGHLFRA